MKLGTRRNRNVVIGFIVVCYPVVVRCGMRCDPGVVGVAANSMEQCVLNLNARRSLFLMCVGGAV